MTEVGDCRVLDGFWANLNLTSVEITAVVCVKAFDQQYKDEVPQRTQSSRFCACCGSLCWFAG